MPTIGDAESRDVYDAVTILLNIEASDCLYDRSWSDAQEAFNMLGFADYQKHALELRFGFRDEETGAIKPHIAERYGIQDTLS